MDDLDRGMMILMEENNDRYFVNIILHGQEVFPFLYSKYSIKWTRLPGHTACHAFVLDGSSYCVVTATLFIHVRVGPDIQLVTGESGVRPISTRFHDMYMIAPDIW